MGALVALVAACSSIIENRGNSPSADFLSQIKPGVQTKEDVSSLLGTPSTTSNFGDETWYYISGREEYYAFFYPEELERKIISVHFDAHGVVTDLKTYGLKDGRIIQPVEQTTPTAGTEMTVLQQFLGNVGRFSNTKDKDKAP
ncbi:MAG: outer membrane protein assembly factor BamE [Alphaproteobacteria bacterium]|nr:outer membrane protein assembly factor BamE [Alphaproteobacteria bacterium]